MKKVLGALLMAAALALTACGGQSSAPAKDAGGGASVSQNTDIKAAIAVDFTTMDPQDTNDTLSCGIQRMIMDGLFGFDDKMKVYPMLATGYRLMKLLRSLPSLCARVLNLQTGRPGTLMRLLSTSINGWARMGKN